MSDAAIVVLQQFVSALEERAAYFEPTDVSLALYEVAFVLQERLDEAEKTMEARKL